MDEAIQLASVDDSARKMSDLVTELARALVDKPEEVSVETLPDGEGILLRLHVAPSDVGKVIGKQGRTARSVRTVLSAASMKLKRRFSLDIVEENGAS
ncbi:MAG: KH domain-containing protein [Edaphobacter sp.]